MVTPTDYVGNLMELANNRRGEFVEMKYLTGACACCVMMAACAILFVSCFNPSQPLRFDVPRLRFVFKLRHCFHTMLCCCCCTLWFVIICRQPHNASVQHPIGRGGH